MSSNLVFYSEFLFYIILAEGPGVARGGKNVDKKCIA